MKSLSPSSTTTPTSRPGRPWPGNAASPCAGSDATRRRGQLDWDDFEQAVTPRTRLVAIGAASNAIGTINDVARATALAHGVGALAFVDAVHYAPHALVDVRALGCDLLACSAYKFYGPHVGVLYGRHDLLASLDVPKLQPAPDTAPERMETGTQNHEGIVGAGAAVTFLASLAVSAPGESLSRRAALERVFAELHARGHALVTRLYTGLQALPGVTRLRPAALGAADTDGGLRREGPRRPTKSHASWCRAGCSCPTATSTRRPSSSGSATAATASCAPAARATPPRTKWSG